MGGESSSFEFVTCVWVLIIKDTIMKDKLNIPIKNHQPL